MVGLDPTIQVASGRDSPFSAVMTAQSQISYLATIFSNLRLFSSPHVFAALARFPDSLAQGMRVRMRLLSYI